VRVREEREKRREDTSTSTSTTTAITITITTTIAHPKPHHENEKTKKRKKRNQRNTSMPTFPPRLLILSLSLSALSSIPVLAHASTVDAHLTQQQQYDPAPRNAAPDSNPAQIPLPLPLPLPPADDADADAEGPQTQPKVRRCGWEIMEDGEIPPSLYVHSIPVHPH
jgi:hypothetical protein